MIKNILVVFIPEHQGYAPLKHAIDIAKGINVPMLWLLYVIPTTKIMIPIPMPPQGMFSPVPMRDSPACKELIDMASMRLSEFENICSKSGIACSSNTILGKRGYLTAEMATLSHLMVCEKRPENNPLIQDTGRSHSALFLKRLVYLFLRFPKNMSKQRLSRLSTTAR